MVKLFISFATEDFVTPQHNDALLKICEILYDRGIKGCFHLTGEFARYLRREGRVDVINALKKHEIGYHGNTHGCYPFIGKICEENSWDDAVSILMKTEARGIIDIKEIFGVRPGYYVLEFTKAPQLIYALKNLGVDLIGFSRLPSAGRPFSYYAGSLCYTGFLMGLESPPCPGRLDGMKKEFDSIYRKAATGDSGGIIKLFNHPYKFVYNSNIASWVSLNRIYKNYNIHGSWKIPCESFYDKKTFESLFGEFEQFIDYVLAKEGTEFSTTVELAGQYRKNCCLRIKLEDVLMVTKKITEKFTYQKIEDKYYSPAEIYAFIVSALAEYVKKEKLPDYIFVRNPLGPTGMINSVQIKNKFTPDELLSKVPELDRLIDIDGKLPSIFTFSGVDFSPSQVLTCLGVLLLQITEGKELSAIKVPVINTFPEIVDEKYFREDSFTKPSYPDGFVGKNICNHCRQQSWTYKPA